MAKPIKRGGSWFIQVRSKKRSFSRSMSFPTRAEAIEWRDETLRRLRTGAVIIDHTRTVGDVLDRHLKARAGTDDERRIKAIRARSLSEKRLVDLTITDFAEYRDERLQSVVAESVRRELVILSAAFTMAKEEWGWTPEHPMKGLRWPARGDGRERLVTNEELDRLWHIAGPDLVTNTARSIAAFAFACLTGMRSGEVLSLTRKNVYLDKDYVFVGRGKTRAARRAVPLLTPARELLQRVMALGFDPVFGLSEGSRDALFRKAVKQAGITDLHFHDSRHTAITALSRKMELLTLARAVGITNLKTLLVYYNETAEETAARLNATSPDAAPLQLRQ